MSDETPKEGELWLDHRGLALPIVGVLLVVTSGCGEVRRGAEPGEAGDGRVLCGDESTDLRSDPLSCGTCGTQCGVVELLGDREYAPVFARDARHAYFAVFDDIATRLGSVLRVPLSGGPPVAIATGLLDPTALAADGESVYVATLGGELTRVPSEGGEPVEIARGRSMATALAVADRSVYWFAGGVLSRVSTDGGAVSNLASGDADVATYQLVADETGVYWATARELRRTRPDGETVTLAPWSPLLLGTAQLAIDATHVYFPDAGWIRRVSKDGGEVERAAEGDAWSVAVDGSRLYWSVGSRVRAASLSGGPTRTLASDMHSAWNLAVRDGVLTWINMGSRFGPQVGFPGPPVADRALMRLGACEAGECL